YLYINQKNGTFKEQGEQQMMHTSKFSMGVDVADINNDAYPEIISMDMLPFDPYDLKRSLGDDYDIFNYKIRSGYTYQYTRNNLQYNRKNGMFSETGLYSGIATTDWSWAPLWVDFDNDGLKDLFVSNGIPKRMNDIDYINFVSNGEIQKKILANDMEKDMSLIDKFPEIKLPNNFFRNRGDLSFADEEINIENNQPTFSNGAVYADFDNDGDQDIVVNNIDNAALLYENKTADTTAKSSLQIILQGSEKNVNAVGAKIILHSNNEIRTYEKFPAKGFLSSMEIPIQIGLKNIKVDSAFLIWPDNTYQQLSINPGIAQLKIAYRRGLPSFDFTRLQMQNADSAWQMEDITYETNLNFLHQENHFGEFDREPLIPHMVSTEGPALAVADINKDGLEDVFIGSARNKKSAIFLQQTSGKFLLSMQPILENDSSYEDVSACWADMNNDGNIDLVVASGGNEFYGHDQHNTPRIYVNDGKANFTRMHNPFDSVYITASCVVPNDFNDDGFMDLFIGARVTPWEYGQVPKSYLLLNDRKGKFKDVTNSFAEGLSNAGFVTHALWFDIDKDYDNDLLISLEWGGIAAYINNKGRPAGSSGRGSFTKKLLTKEKGWWNFILPFDVDNDGDIDLVAGNLGLNSRLKASVKQPVRLYYNDFDGNGKKEQVLTYHVGEKEIPFANKAELEKQVPLLKKKFLYAENFAKATLSDLFSSDKLKKAEVLSADYFSNAVFINNGNFEFKIIPLPWQAQLSSYKDAVIINANNDNLPDILLMGNYYDNNIEMGRYDADFGTLLINQGKGSFTCQSLNGLALKGQVRHILPISIKNQPAYIIARNNDSAKVIRFTSLKN
ncbi:MAG: VCBS repeat-containing protein, partial [Chitinophagaceae bacterium]